jgi:hypothetical protein
MIKPFMTKGIWISAALFCALSGNACGDDDTAAASNSAGASGHANAAAGNGAAAGSGGAAGAPSLVDTLTMLTMPMCDTSVTSESSCGSSDCPDVSSSAATMCTVNCCTTDQRCGTRNVDQRLEMFLGSTCTAAALPDARCPSTTIIGMTLPGCCDPQGRCGQAFGGICVAAPTATSCDASGDGGVSDAGL